MSIPAKETLVPLTLQTVTAPTSGGANGGGRLPLNSGDRLTRIEWFTWQSGEEYRLSPDDDGLVRSRIFPGLWLDPVTVWQRDIAGGLAVLQKGLATPEHAEFAQRLS